MFVKDVHGNYVSLGLNTGTYSSIYFATLTTENTGMFPNEPSLPALAKHTTENTNSKYFLTSFLFFYMPDNTQQIMSIYSISQKIFIEEVSKIIPEWNLEIIPADYVEFPEKYNMPKVTVILKHKQHSKTILEKSLQTNGMRDAYGESSPLASPWHLGGLYTIIAAARCPDDPEEDMKLFNQITTHFSKFFEDRKNNISP